MTFNEAMSFVDSYSKSGKAVTDLSRARELMKRMGNPEKQLKFIHVAGTNGKGSTVEYISNALIYSGYKTGQFTSPYITHYADRIRINGGEIDEKSLCEIAEKVKNSVADAEYSQFEITMAIALLWYVREKCDIVVLEAGIGGLLDCTNVIPPPLVSVITSISLDHTAILGDTVEKIAAQKAGIIKENSAVVLSCDNSHETYEIVKKAADKVGSELITMEHFDFEMLPVESDGQPFVYCGKSYKTAMFGNAQPINAVTAIEICHFLRKKGFDISEENIKKSVETSQIKARCQYIDGEPPFIIDGGHNPEGIANFVGVLDKINRPVYAVLGMVDTKDYEQGATRIAHYAKKIYTVDSFAYNAVNADKLAEIASESAYAESCSSLDEAVGKATGDALMNDGIVAVCGSLYLASEHLNNCENQ